MQTKEKREKHIYTGEKINSIRCECTNTIQKGQMDESEMPIPMLFNALSSHYLLEGKNQTISGESFN